MGKLKSKRWQGKKEKGFMLVKLDKKGRMVGIMPAINPDGSTAKPPKGFQWIPCESRSWVV
jgi:hypothetical protein